MPSITDIISAGTDGPIRAQKRSFDRLVRTAHRAIRATPLSEDPQ